MPIVVQKYGGTSVATVERIQAVADRVVRTREAGNDVIVVVSAMGDTTDELATMARQITEIPDPREMDMLLTAGERIAMSLLGIAINARGCRAASYTGSQAGIITDTQHGAAKIVEIRPRRVLEALDSGNVVVLAGFQGLSDQYEITTLGRGGSDLTAVAMAGAVGAAVCEIYTDVAGVFTADPRVVPEARKVDGISYEEMLELAAAGAKVLQSRSVEMARRHGVRIHVRSSFSDEDGTWVQEVDGQMEGVLISGAALDTDEAKVTIDQVPDRPGVAAAIFKAIASAGINVDMIVQNVSHDGTTDMSFTAPLDDLPRLKEALGSLVRDIGAHGSTVDDGIAKISLVGAGMKSHPGVAADMFDTLANEGINIEMISTSPIRISCVIRREKAEQALRAVHARFGLDA
jgi:aspartate kinase